MTPLEALARCQRAWEATQPQLFMELYPDGLDEPQPSALRFVEPVASAASPGGSPSGGLTAGAEPCRGHSYELTAQPAASPAVSSSAAPAARSAGSAPLANQTAAGRVLPDGTSDLQQEVTL